MTTPALCFNGVDLRNDPNAATYVKDEVVQVRFATAPGVVVSSVGPNHYAAGDALVTGANGDTWGVSRDRFEPRYLPVPPLAHGADGAYRNRPQPVLARQIDAPFSVVRSAGGDVLKGVAGDWLLQYAPGDWGIVDAARFALVYKKV